MSFEKFFYSTRLLTLYQQGALDLILKKFSKEINGKNYLGCGAEASSFFYKNDQVLKICAKNIGYFKHAHIGTTAQQFKDDINKLDPYFLPVNEILHEDDNIMIYTQYLCQPLNKDMITPHLTIEIFKLVLFMLEKNLILTDLTPQNLALYQNRLVVFDYHSLHSFFVLKKGSTHERPHHTKWWRRLFKNLTRYLTIAYAPNQISNYDLIFQNSSCRKLKTHSYLPIKFIDLLRYVATYQKRISRKVFFELYHNCIQAIIQDFGIFD